MKKIDLLEIRPDLERIYQRVDENLAKFGELPEEEIEEMLQKYRRKKSRAAEGS